MVEATSVLLVEDDPTARRILRALLSETLSSARIVEAASGEEGLARLREAPFDLVVSDYRLGMLDGISLLETVREEQPRAGRILVTAHADFDLAREAIDRAGVHAFLQKPVAGPVLERAIRSARERSSHEASFAADG
jgi:two-component system, probable response regulator PhcQ